MKRPTERETCKRCHRHRNEVGQMSWTGQCGECGRERLKENILGLYHHEGEPLERWRAGMARCVGAVLPERQ